MTHTLGAHARFAPSAAKRWLTCPGSVGLIEKLPSLTSDAAEEGTQAHKKLEAALRQWYSSLCRGEPSVSTLSVALAKYVQYVTHLYASLSERHGRNLVTFDVEHRFDLAMCDEELFGTADTVLTAPNEVHIIDYKHGSRVEVKTPEQLAVYALAFLDGPSRPSAIWLHIVQPNLEFPPDAPLTKTWKLSYGELEEMRTRVRTAIWKAKRCADLTFGSHCDSTFCPARSICPAYTRELKRMLGAGALLKTPETWTIAEKKALLRLKPSFEKSLKLLEEQTIADIEANPGKENVLECGVRYTAGRATWAVDKDELVERFGEDVLTTQPISPAQVVSKGVASISELEDDELIKRSVRKTLTFTSPRGAENADS